MPIISVPSVKRLFRTLSESNRLAILRRLLHLEAVDPTEEGGSPVFPTFKALRIRLLQNSCPSFYL